MVNDCCLIFIILLFPPVGVFMMRGCNADFWINFCLTLLFCLPGCLHAFYLLIKDRENRQPEDKDVEAPPPV